MPDATPSALPLIVSDFPFAPSDAARLRQAVGDDQLVLVEGRQALRDALGRYAAADVLCSFRPPQDARALAPHLTWIALPSAGAERVLRDLSIPAGANVVITTANGIHAVPISEFVLSLLLQWAGRWPAIHALQRAGEWPDRAEWERLRGSELHGAVLGVIGLGAIGRQVARLGRAFGMRVVATRRSAQAGATDPDVDELLPLTALDRLLERADYVVLAVPSTPETHYLINGPRLARMKRSAFLVNIARGDILDQEALVAALRAGTIAGAGLDVFATEPLPAGDPLWTMPNVILSPHMSGLSPHYSERFTALFLENIARWRAGQPLKNAVDPARGY